MKKYYDMVIIGGGITGTAMFYTLSKYTNLQSILLVEKYKDLSSVNSHYNSNSQTLHFGDIETNFTFEKSQEVKQASSLLAGFATKYAPDTLLLSHKMVLAVGEKEVRELEERYQEFKDLYPLLRKINRDEISKIEPIVTKDRNPKEKLLALLNDKGYAVNYQKISKAFVKEALKENKETYISLNNKVIKIKRFKNNWKIITSQKTVRAKFVIVAAGPHSLIFAKSMGLGKNLGILPVAGSFYRAKEKLLNGKVYTMQIKKLPFAAVHGDPYVNNPQETRFGPTAKVLPLLERHRWNTFNDFLKTSVYTFDGILSLLNVISDKTIFLYVLKNLAFDIPVFGKKLFLKDVKKIIPSIKLSDIEYGEKLGGIRPQVIDTLKKQMQFGDAKIINSKIIFDITPSPGASVSLDNARKNALEIRKHLSNYHFDEARFLKDHEFEY